MDGVLTPKLLDWYRRNGRRLPWRSDAPDPWIVLVSEFLLHQTRVETVAPRFDVIIATIPTPAHCAALSDPQLDRLWQGLGYYRRARHLRDAARQICDRHDGRVPDTPDALLALSGIGPYTVGAIMAIAFNQPVAGVDGNIARVWARVHGSVCSANDAAPSAREWLDRLFATGPPRDVMQAIMDLGATVCTPRRPNCGHCPLADHCVARTWQNPAATPVRRRRQSVPVESVVHAWITDGWHWFLQRRPPGLLGERPGPPCLPGTEPPPRLPLGAGTALLQSCGPAYQHVFTHRRWDVVPALYRWHAPDAPGWPDRETVAVPVRKLHDLGLPRAFSRALPWLTAQQVSGG